VAAAGDLANPIMSFSRIRPGINLEAPRADRSDFDTRPC